MTDLQKNEIDVLRQLAQEYSEIASQPKQSETKKLWQELNRGNMQRPMVVIDQIPWHEMDIDGSLVNKITNPYWVNIETALRHNIYKAKYMPADMVAQDYILLPRLIGDTGFGVKITEDAVASDKNNGVVGHKYYNQFETLEDVNKITDPIITIDRKGETEIRQQADMLFDGIIPYKMQGTTIHLGLWDLLTQWMGVENCYFAIIDEPELIHAVMDRLTNAVISKIEQLNKEKAFDVYGNTCHCSYTFSDDLPTIGCDPDNPTSKDAWAFGMAQLFSSVSPDVTNEFEVPYMQRLFPYFGAIYYGCCDRLDDRMDLVNKMPNIRKISCSPWSIREDFAQVMPKNCIMSNKPNPAFLAADSVNWDEIRQDFRRTINAAKSGGVGLELIIKDISTVKYDPQRLFEWSRVALEEVSR